MSSTATHFTKIFPKRADITGSPNQAFHMLGDRAPYYKYLTGGVSAGTIAAFGTIDPGVLSNTSTHPRSIMILEEIQSALSATHLTR